MKSHTIATACMLALAACGSASADEQIGPNGSFQEGPSNNKTRAGFMLGICHNFGGSTGVTLKILSTNKQDKAVVALGVSYFPNHAANKLGLDLGLGYNFRRGAATVGWDFLHNEVQGAIGFSDTKKPPAPAPAPAPEPTPSGSRSSASLDRVPGDSPTSST